MKSYIEMDLSGEIHKEDLDFMHCEVDVLDYEYREQDLINRYGFTHFLSGTIADRFLDYQLVFVESILTDGIQVHIFNKPEKIRIIDAIVKSRLAISKAEARRYVNQGYVAINGYLAVDSSYCHYGDLISVGKKSSYVKRSDS